MVEKLGRIVSLINQILMTAFVKLTVLLMFMTACAYVLDFFLPRLASLAIGNGWSYDGSPVSKWHGIMKLIGEKGIAGIEQTGESVVLLTGIYSAIQFLVFLFALTLLAGLAAYFVLGVVRNGVTQFSTFRSSLRSVLSYSGGLLFIAGLLLVAGAIGDAIRIASATPTFAQDSAIFVGWSLAGSVAVIALSVLFVRLVYLPYVRCESAESFTDSLRYSLHVTRGNFWFVVLAMLPVVSGAMLITRLTRDYPVVATIGQQAAIMAVVIVDVAIYITLSSKEVTTSARDTDGSKRMG